MKFKLTINCFIGTQSVTPTVYLALAAMLALRQQRERPYSLQSKYLLTENICSWLSYNKQTKQGIMGKKCFVLAALSDAKRK